MDRDPAAAPGERVADYLGLVKTHSRESFLQAYWTPVLLLEPHDPKARSLELKTDTVDIAGLLEQAAQESRQTEVLQIVKRGQDLYRNFIWVGRETGCDVVLPFEGISKLHAHFVRRDDGVYALADGGSKNGTFVDDRRLESKKPHLLADNAGLRFGAIRARYRTAAGFWEVLGQAQRGGLWGGS